MPLVSSGEIVLYGRSIGSGPSIHLAVRTAVRAMVLQSDLVIATRTEICLFAGGFWVVFGVLFGGLI